MVKIKDSIPISRCLAVVVPEKSAQSGIALDLGGIGRTAGRQRDHVERLVADSYNLAGRA